MKKELIELRVNGRKYELAVEANALLLDVLRQEALPNTGPLRRFKRLMATGVVRSADIAPPVSWSLSRPFSTAIPTPPSRIFAAH